MLDRAFRLFVLCAALAGSVRSALAQQLTSGSVGSVDTNGMVAFSLTFDRVPDFKTVDSANRQTNSFQCHIGASTVPPTSPPARPYASLIRGEEIHVAGDLRVRNDNPSDPDPDSGGWGSVRGRVNYVLNGQMLTFSIPASVLNVSGPFGYKFDLSSNGGTTSSYSGVSGGPIKLVADPPVFLNPVGLDSIAGKVYRDSYRLGALLGETTIVFEDGERFTYLLNRFVNSANIDQKTRILAPKPDGKYRFTRTSNNEATVELNFADGTQTSLLLFFQSPTAGFVISGGVLPAFSFSDLAAWKVMAVRNVSMRGTVSPGHPLVVGLIAPASSEVLIRAVGPSLRAFGITSGWSDPDFQLYSGDKPYQSPEKHNADWDAPAGGLTPDSPGPGLQKVFSYVGAFPLQAGSKDAADVVRLTPGNYTIVCSTAASDEGGDVLVEVYFLP